jgi:hypothetical protein
VDKPIELVFLILSPAHLPDVQIQVLALASRAALDRQLAHHLSSSRNSEEALAAIRDSEMMHNAPAATQTRHAESPSKR